MKLNSLGLCVALLAALSAAVYFANRPDAPPTDPRSGTWVLDPSVAAKADTFVVTEEGKSVTLVKAPDGGWIDASYFGLPADFEKLTRLVDDLTQAKVDRFVTSTPSSLARLGFKDSKVELLDAQGTKLWSLLLGKNDERGNGRFIRFGNEQEAFIAPLHLWLDAEPKNWADAQLIRLKEEDVAKIEVPVSPAPVTLSRLKGSQAWSSDQAPVGKQVQVERVTSVIASLVSLKFIDTAAVDDPKVLEAKRYLKTFRIETFGGKKLEISFGRRPSDQKPGSGKIDSKPESVPPGPTFAFISSSDAKDPVNALMARRAYQVEDYTYEGLPSQSGDLFAPARGK